MTLHSSGVVTGGRVTTYLLEKTRVARQLAGERSYHVFYQLCQGADDDMRARLGLKEAAEFRSLVGLFFVCFFLRFFRDVSQGMHNRPFFCRTCHLWISGDYSSVLIPPPPYSHQVKSHWKGRSLRRRRLVFAGGRGERWRSS